MEEMLVQLEKVKDMLEQILGITQNQMTVLIEGQHSEEGLELVEQMALLKGELTTEMEEAEACFQQLYQVNRGLVQGDKVVALFQSKISEVFLLKDQIIAAEQKNVLLLQETLRKYVERVELPKDPKRVTEAYQKQKK
ncbi:MAG: hypothetical protein ACRCTE_13390 [Cellulosilyticaceae bacterium]